MKIRGPKVIVGPEDEPLTVAECRAHLEAAVYGDSTQDDLDDAQIAAFLAAAREYCEQFLGLSLAQRVLEIELDAFPNETDDGTVEIELPFGPVVELRSVDPDGSSSSSDSLLTPDTYRLDDYSSPNRLVPVTSWPSATGPIRIRYLAGYGLHSDNDGVAAPYAIRAAILLVLGHLYAHREASAEKALAELPLGVEALLRPHRVRLGMA
jgi:uncharacterized phiE125 gp8 family phage protein